MIASQDRSGWFGASDTARVMGAWSGKTFDRWWLEKLGAAHNNIKTPAMIAGTYYEHRILDALGIVQRDRQIKIRKLRLRVNLDGEDANTIHEVKTHKSDAFNVTKAYWQQCQVEMYASGKACQIDAYRMTDNDYDNFFNEIDLNRITIHPIERDEEFIREYVERLKHLKDCLLRGVHPNGNH